jgi:hypothetical protein
MSSEKEFRIETGVITSVSVLPATAEGANYKINLTTQGKLAGINYTSLWTYVQVQRNDGSIYGGGDGVLTTECGEVVFLKGSGSACGRREDGAIEFKVINHQQTQSEKLREYNGTACVGTYLVEADGTTSATFSLL